MATTGLRAPEDFERIFQRDHRVLGLIHYFTKDTETLGNQLLSATASGGMGCDGVQINVSWPPPDQILIARDFGDYGRVVLQVGPKMLSSCSSPAIVAELVADREYRDIITDVLIDVSAGNGVAIDVESAREIVEAVRAWNNDIGIGIAGGLCAETLPAVTALVREYDLSIDAEGRLRNEHDELDLDKVRTYLGAAAAMWGWA